jgi:hypothetical protein
MKTLKFRIYDKDKKGFHYLNSIWNMPDPCYDGEVQQWTGLLDSHGKEIWEGNIIKFEKNNYQVLFNNGCFVATRQNKSPYSYKELWNICFVSEVIGDIYSNPELLNSLNQND